MALFRRSPMFDLIDDVWGSRYVSFSPSVDVHSNDKEVVLDVELPGIDPEKVDVSVNNNVLTIRGEKEYKEKNYDRLERYYGSFSRSFTLPNNIDVEKIEAKGNNGVLTITIPKEKKVLPKKIKILPR